MPLRYPQDLEYSQRFPEKQCVIFSSVWSYHYRKMKFLLSLQSWEKGLKVKMDVFGLCDSAELKWSTMAVTLQSPLISIQANLPQSCTAVTPVTELCGQDSYRWQWLFLAFICLLITVLILTAGLKEKKDYLQLLLLTNSCRGDRVPQSGQMPCAPGSHTECPLSCSTNWRSSAWASLLDDAVMLSCQLSSWRVKVGDVTR